jgi:hypothetical protein
MLIYRLYIKNYLDGGKKSETWHLYEKRNKRQTTMRTNPYPSTTVREICLPPHLWGELRLVIDSSLGYMINERCFSSALPIGQAAPPGLPPVCFMQGQTWCWCEMHITVITTTETANCQRRGPGTNRPQG